MGGCEAGCFVVLNINWIRHQVWFGRALEGEMELDSSQDYRSIPALNRCWRGDQWLTGFGLHSARSHSFGAEHHCRPWNDASHGRQP